MKIAGIIAEYNPFHAGHALQIQLLREAGFEAIVAVMSPSVVQRGEAALFPCDVRVSAALIGGVDLLVSLPAPYALCSAEGFAAAGVRVLTALGVCDTLAFGMEAESTDFITQAAYAMRNAAYPQALQQELAKGLAYAPAVQRALAAFSPEAAALMREPNNILAVEYCKAIAAAASPLVPYGIRRVGAAHDASTADGFIASASAIRTIIAQKGVQAAAPYLPPAALPIYLTAEKNGDITSKAAFSVALLSRLRALDAKTLAAVRGTSEGLENRLFAAVQTAKTADALYAALKTRRYAHSRLRRLALDAALGYTKAVNMPVPYVQVLGASARGISLLKRAKASATLPFGSSLASLARAGENAAIIAAAHAAAEDFTALCLASPRACGQAFTSAVQMPKL